MSILVEGVVGISREEVAPILFRAKAEAEEAQTEIQINPGVLIRAREASLAKPVMTGLFAKFVTKGVMRLLYVGTELTSLYTQLKLLQLTPTLHNFRPFSTHPPPLPMKVGS